MTLNYTMTVSFDELIGMCTNEVKFRGSIPEGKMDFTHKSDRMSCEFLSQAQGPRCLDSFIHKGIDDREIDDRQIHTQIDT